MKLKKKKKSKLEKKRKRKKTNYPGRTRKTSKRWISRIPKYSKLPYLITISFKRKNIFLTASDFKGRIKVWTSAGRVGFKNQDKIQHYSVITITAQFLKQLFKFGITQCFLKLKNFHRNWYAFRKLIHRRKRDKELKLRFIALFIQLSINFNGCRRKKVRRSKPRRFPKRRQRIYKKKKITKKQMKKIRENRKQIKKKRITSRLNLKKK